MEKTLEIHLQELREGIAPDIEQWMIHPDASDSDRVKFEIARDTFARVARAHK